MSVRPQRVKKETVHAYLGQYWFSSLIFIAKKETLQFDQMTTSRYRSSSEGDFLHHSISDNIETCSGEVSLKPIADYPRKLSEPPLLNRGKFYHMHQRTPF